MEIFWLRYVSSNQLPHVSTYFLSFYQTLNWRLRAMAAGSLDVVLFWVVLICILIILGLGYWCSSFRVCSRSLLIERCEVHLDIGCFEIMTWFADGLVMMTILTPYRLVMVQSCSLVDLALLHYALFVKHFGGSFGDSIEKYVKDISFFRYVSLKLRSNKGCYCWCTSSHNCLWLAGQLVIFLPRSVFIRCW